MMHLFKSIWLNGVMMQKMIKIGIIGADTTHVSAFASSFQKNRDFEVVGVYDDQLGQLDFFNNRRDGTLDAIHKLGIPIYTNPAFLEEVDAILLLTGDAATHRTLFENHCCLGIPVFIDKPITYSFDDFIALKKCAQAHNVPVFSASALRYIHDIKKHDLPKAQQLIISGPLTFQSGIPDYHWYGIHLVEILGSLFTGDLMIDTMLDSETKETIQGSVGNHKVLLEGIKVGNPPFKINDCVLDQPLYEGLLEAVTAFISTGKAPLSWDDMEQTLRNLDVINRNRRSKG